MRAAEWPMASQGGIVDSVTEAKLVSHGRADGQARPPWGLGNGTGS